MKKIWIGLIAFVAMAGSSFGFNRYWDGSTDGNWNTADNWSAMPSSTDFAIIRTGSNRDNIYQADQHVEVQRLTVGEDSNEVNLYVGAGGGSLTMGNTTTTQNNLGQHTNGTVSVTLKGGAWTAANTTLIGANSSGHTDFNVEAGALTLVNTNIGTNDGTADFNIIGDSATQVQGNGWTFGSNGTLSFDFDSTGVSQLDVTSLNADGATLDVDLTDYEGTSGTFTLVDADRDNTGDALESIFSTVNLTEGAYTGSYVTQDQTSDLITLTLPGPRPAQPNLVLILADDLGWQDIKVYDLMETNVVDGFGGTNVYETPYMDQLASEGTLFTHAYSPAPVCAPSRAAILSGKHPARTDVTNVAGGACPKAGSSTFRFIRPHWRSSMKGEEITLPEMLDAAGYFTGMFGKWHISESPDTPGPDEQGFNRTFQGRGMTTKAGDRFAGFATADPGDTYQLDANGFAKDEVTEEALSFLADAVSQSDPFFCYYSTWLVHGPWQMRTESLLQKYSERMGYSYPLDGTETFGEGQNNPFYGAMVESFDYYMSRLITYLKETDDPRWPGHKLIENTYVILTSDNGGMESGDAQGQVTDNYPLDKGKIWIKEGGTRVPFIAVGPGIASNTVSDVVVNGLDLYPTFLALAGESIPDERLDGCDLSALLLNDPQDPAQVTEAESGDERESMFWHYPHSGRFATTLLKDGWKLYKNYDYLWNSTNGTLGPLQAYSLYQLYDSNGDPVDVGEMTDLIDTQSAVADELIPELEAWIEEVDARPTYENPERADMPLSELSPKILVAGNDETMAWVTWNTDRAEVKYLDLLYCKNPSGTSSEEWFKIPVPFTHSKGWAEVEIPDGAQSYLFNLIDENSFFVSSVYLTGHSGYDSEVVPLRSWEPRGTAPLSDAGTVFPTSDVLFSNTVGDAAVAVRDEGTNLQLLGQTFTVTEPVRLSALTLQAYSDKTLGSSDSAEYYLWIGEYESDAPSTNALRTKVFEQVDMRGVSLVASNYYTIDFDDTVLLPGSYAFQLKWKGQAAGNNSYWMRAGGDGAYADGDLLHILTTAGSTIDLPFSDSEDAGSDMVFALHGTIDYFGEWTVENGLDRAPSENPYDDGFDSGTLQKNSVFFTKGSSGAWTMSDGVLGNASASNDKIGEGAVAKAVDLTGLADSDRSQLSLRFDFTTGDAAEKLYLHLWGYTQDVDGTNPSLINLGAQNGSAWVGGDANMVAYNLAKPDGVFTGSAGAGSDAAAILTGSAGAQSYSNTFDVSTFTTAPDAISEYDYLVIAFAREVGGTTTPSVSITDIELSVVGGASLLPVAVDYSEDRPTDDPNGDGLESLLEYAFGGNPNLGNNGGILPVLGPVDSEFEYIYLRRRDAATRGLAYDVQRTDSLVVPWSSAQGTEESAVIDDDFELVTKRVDTAGTTNGFLRLTVEQSE